MQFAGQRTNMQLELVGEPVNVLLKLTPEIVPDPDAILVTGITPQSTLADGVTEVEFLKQFHEEVATPGTIFVGYNTVRFDDEFMRFLQYRNFYDAYEWQWKDGRSRWDLLDVVRMTRALRPEGIEWPFAPDGKPSNRLELLTAVNKLDHLNAHDALSDVNATIAVAKLIQTKQPKLFEFLLDIRDKKKVAALVEKDEPFVYSSGRFASEFEKTTVAVRVCNHPKKQGSALVYDLRQDPAKYMNMSAEQLAEAWRWKKPEEGKKAERLPVKPIQYNRCPAVAPMGVLDEKSRERLRLDLDTIQKHLKTLRSVPDLAGRLCEALEILDKKMQGTLLTTVEDADAKLYDGFFDDHDRQAMRMVRVAEPNDLAKAGQNLHDDRLQSLLPLYKARNYPDALDTEERTAWEAFCKHRLLDGGQQSRLAKYFARLQTLASTPNLTDDKRYLLEELQLYGESIMPLSEDM